MRFLRAGNVTPFLLAVLLCGGLGVVVLTDAPPRVDLALTDGGTWLAHRPSGSLVHVSALSGRTDAVVELPGAVDHPIEVTASAGQLLATDTETGTVYRADPARLTVTATLDSGDPDARLFLAGDVAYLLAPASATVQRLDPARLVATGAAVRLPSVGDAGQTPDGALWVVVPTEGTVVRVTDAGAGVPIPIARPAELPDAAPGGSAEAGPDVADLAVAIVTDTAVVVDRPARRVTPVGPEGPAVPVELPPGGPITMPATRLDGSLLPLVAAGADSGDPDVLLVVDLPSASVTRYEPPPDAPATGFGPPLLHAGHVFLPHDGLGELWDLDLAAGRFGPPVAVVDPADDSADDSADGSTDDATEDGPRLAVSTTDGQVWVDDRTGTIAIALVSDGVRRIVKEVAGVAGAAATGPARPLPPARLQPSSPAAPSSAAGSPPAAASPPPAASPPSSPPAADSLAFGRPGYWLAYSDGTVQAYGSAQSYGPRPDLPGDRPGDRPGLVDRVVAVTPSATGRGLWLVDATGRVHAFGDAEDLAPRGEPGAVVAAAASPTGGGFWTVTASGHVTAFGEVVDHGSPEQPVAAPVVGIAATVTGGGYWLVDTAGGVQAFGDAARPVPAGGFATPITAVAAIPTGLGYLVVAADGEVAVVEGGHVRHERPQAPVPSRVVGVVGTPTGQGYWLADASGAVLAAGDARQFGDADPAGRVAVGLAPVP